MLSRNVHRRHLTSEQKRQAIAAYIKADPTTSDRTVAKELGVERQDGGEGARRFGGTCGNSARPDPDRLSRAQAACDQAQADTQARGDCKARADRRGHGRRAADHNRATRWADRELTWPDRPRQAGTGIAKVATGAIEPARDDSAIGPAPDDSDTRPDEKILVRWVAG